MLIGCMTSQLEGCDDFREQGGWESVPAPSGYLFCMIYRFRVSGCRGNCGVSSQVATRGWSSPYPISYSDECKCCRGTRSFLHTPWRRCLRIQNGMIQWVWLFPHISARYSTLGRCECSDCRRRGVLATTEIKAPEPVGVPEVDESLTKIRAEACSKAGLSREENHSCLGTRSETTIKVQAPREVLAERKISA